MTMRHHVSLRLIWPVLLIACAACQRHESGDESAGVRQVVSEFGQELKQVPLSADRQTTIAAIEKHYRRLVSPSLLEQWTADPSAAPGRVVSSPWPDRIEIDSVLTVSGTEYHVTGRIMEVTSVEMSQGQPGTATPVDIILAKQEGRWLITGFTQEKAAETEAPSENAGRGMTEAPDSTSAVAVLETYYDAINRKDYRRAYTLWASNGEASGKTLDQFRAGFAKTESVTLTLGAPGPMGAAAGSRYIEILVTIHGRLSDGAEQHFSGTYTLRRSVVDGATEEQRQWRIYKAHLVQNGT